jgi:hypothetical protein
MKPVIVLGNSLPVMNEPGLRAWGVTPVAAAHVTLARSIAARPDRLSSWSEWCIGIHPWFQLFFQMEQAERRHAIHFGSQVVFGGQSGRLRNQRTGVLS